MKAIWKLVITVFGIGALVWWLSKRTPKPQAPHPSSSNAEVKSITEDERPHETLIERAIRRQIKKPKGALTKTDLERVTELDLRRNELKNVYDVVKLTGLIRLHLGHNQVTDVTGLENLTQLTELSLSYNNLTGIPKGLEKVTQLKVLYLDDNELTDVKNLKKLVQLEQLSLKANPDLSMAQISELQKALPRCKIYGNPTN